MWRWVKWITTVLLSGIAIVLLISRTDTRAAIFLNHRLWVPGTARNIDFSERRNFLCIDGDGSVVYFTVPKADFEIFLRKQTWCNNCYGAGPFMPFSERLIGAYPLQHVECKAPAGDVLLIYADTIGISGMVRVGLYTDWN